MDTKVMSADVPRLLAERVDAIAARLDRSPSWIVEEALASWVKQQDDRHNLTLEALADVDGGVVVDHKAIEDWANGLDVKEA